MTETITLRPATAAMKRLRDAIEYGRSSGLTGLADVVDRAGYAVGELRDVLVPLMREAAREIARGDAPAPAAPSDSGSST